MDYKVFPQMNTLVRIQEATLLSGAQKAELSRKAGTDGVFKALISTGFFRFAKPVGSQDLNAALEEETRGWLNWAKEITPDTRIVEIFEFPLMAHNISVFIKEQLLGRELPDLYFQNTVYTAAKLSAIMNEKNIEHPLDEIIKLAIEDALSDFKVHQSFLRVTLIIKFFTHSAISKLSEQIGDDEIGGFIASYIDLEMLSVLIQQRAAKQPLNEWLLTKTTGGKLHSLILPLFHASNTEQDSALIGTPYASVWAKSNDQNTLHLFDVHADDYLIELCKKAKLEAFGLFPLLAFIYVKLSDIKNIRILAAAKQVGAGPEETRERLRIGYEL